MKVRNGFSVMEALVVLLIGGAALTLVFQMGVQGSETGLRLGRRALSAADSEPGRHSLRLILAGIDLHAHERRNDQAATGDARRLIASVDLDRPTMCAPAGSGLPLELRLQATRDGDLLTCVAGDGEPVTLVDLRPARAAFAYSEDGVRWRSRLDASGQGALFVRLASDDGLLDVVEAIDGSAEVGL